LDYKMAKNYNLGPFGFLTRMTGVIVTIISSLLYIKYPSNMFSILAGLGVLVMTLGGPD